MTISASLLSSLPEDGTPYLYGTLLLIAGLCLLQNWTKKEQTYNYPASPPGHFLLGNALDLPDVRKGEHLDTKFLEWSLEYGLVYSVQIPIVGRFIIIADPDLAKFVVATKNFPKSPTYKDLFPVVGRHSILVMEGPEWAQYRRAFTPGFAPAFLHNVTTTIGDKLQRLLRTCDDDATERRETHMLDTAASLTADVIAQVAFGEDWGNSKKYIHMFREAIGVCNQIQNDPMIRFFAWKKHRAQEAINVALTEEFGQVVDRRLEELHQKGNQSDICSLSITHLKEDDGSLTPHNKQVIVDQLKTFYFAGHDTTASTISWCIWLLGQHAEELANVRSELDDNNIFSRGSAHVIPTYAQIQSLQYLDAVIMETLRLYPPAATARYCADKSQKWKDYHIGNSVLFVNHYVMHRHPELWERPNDFWPERFLQGQDFGYKFQPFSRGSRDCIGKYFALLEAKMAVAVMVQRYEFNVVNKDEVPGYALTLFPKDGAKMMLKKR
jgi:cytochrome P450